MRTFRRTVSTLAIVGTVGLTLSGCGWFRGEEEMTSTAEADTTTTTTTPSQPTTVGQVQPVQQRPVTTEQEYQQTLQK